MSDPVIIRRATISEDNRYRYRLTRCWASSLPPMTFVMLNPSTADDRVDDPTIRRCMGFAKREGCGGLIVVNLYALRATDPDELRRTASPFGPRNDEALSAAVAEAVFQESPLVCGWGTKGGSGIFRFLDIARTEGGHLQALGLTKDQHPKHPLYLKSDARLVTYRDFRHVMIAPEAQP